MLSCLSSRIPSTPLMLFTNTLAVPALPSALTGTCTIVSSPVFATNIVLKLLLNCTPFAPNGGTPAVVSSLSLTQIDAVPPLDAIFQITPWNESDTYTLPALSNVSELIPGPVGFAAFGLCVIVEKIDDAP